MAWPVVATLEFSVADDPFDPAPTWADLSGYLLSVPTITRGRSSPLDYHAAGIAQFVLDNDSADLDPQNTSSPFYSGSTQLLPNRQIRCHVPDATTYDDTFTRANSTTDAGALETGETWWSYTGVWGINTNELYCPTPDSAASFLLVDVGEADGYVQFDLGAAGEETQGAVFRWADPTNYWYIARGATANTWDVVKVVDGAPTTVESAAAGSSADGTTVKIAFSADSVGPISINGTPVAATTNTDDHAILATVVGLYGGDTITSSSRWDNFEAGVDQRTLFRGFIEPRGWQIDHANALVTTNCADLLAVIAAHEIPVSGSAAGAGELAGARINRILDQVGVPDAWRAIDPGITIFQGTTFGANALANLQTAAVSEGGNIYIAANGRLVFADRHAPIRRPRTTTAVFTLSDDTDDYEYENRLTRRVFSHDVIHTARYTAEGGDQQSVTDATSQTSYRGSTYDRSGLMMREDPEAYARAEWIVSQWKDPVPYPEYVVVNGAISTSDELVAARIELGDRLTVEITPRNAAQVADDVIVEGVAHSLTPDGWLATLTCSPASRFGFADWSTFLRWDITGHQWKDSAPFKVFAF